MRLQPVVDEADDADAGNRGVDGEIGRGADAHVAQLRDNPSVRGLDVSKDAMSAPYAIGARTGAA